MIPTCTYLKVNCVCINSYTSVYIVELTFERLELLIFCFLQFVCNLGDDEVLRAHLSDGVDQSVQAPGVISQKVQQHGSPLCLCCPAADFFCVVPRQDPTRAQVVQMAFGSDLFT